MATFGDWVEAARLRTLPAAVAPVLVGTGAALMVDKANIGFAVLAACVALAFQIGVNFSNDYSDGIRGTDDVRTGPPRLTGGGKANPTAVRNAAFLMFGLGCLAGLVLVALSDSWILLVAGGLSVVAAWYYTGGKNPYGYMGLGEVFVFVFFGLLATLGTTWTQAHELPVAAWLGAVAVGLIACALLMVNNIRDIPTDSQVGKNTLAVRLTDRYARLVYCLMVGLPLVLTIPVIVSYPWVGLVALTLPLVIILCRRVMRGDTGLALIAVLRDTGFYELGYGLLFLVGAAL